MKYILVLAVVLADGHYGQLVPGPCGTWTTLESDESAVQEQVQAQNKQKKGENGEDSPRV